VAMPQVMEANSREPRLGHLPVEGLTEEVGVNRSAVRPGEHEPVVFVGLAESQPFLELALPPGAKDADCSGVEVDRPAAGTGLDVTDLDGVGD